MDPMCKGPRVSSDAKMDELRLHNLSPLKILLIIFGNGMWKSIHAACKPSSPSSSHPTFHPSLLSSPLRYSVPFTLVNRHPYSPVIEALAIKPPHKTSRTRRLYPKNTYHCATLLPFCASLGPDLEEPIECIETPS